MSQAALEFSPHPPLSKPETIQQQFEAFHKRHPEVYRILVSRARRAMVKDKRVGIGCLWENIRWYFYVERDETFKLNNNYRSRYARLIMDQESDLADYFETRELTAE